MKYFPTANQDKGDSGIKHSPKKLNRSVSMQDGHGRYTIFKRGDWIKIAVNVAINWFVFGEIFPIALACITMKKTVSGRQIPHNLKSKLNIMTM